MSILILRPWSPNLDGDNVPTPSQDARPETFAATVINDQQDWQEIDDPSRDGWETEAFSQRAQTQLDKLGELLLRKHPISAGDTSPLLTADSTCGTLWPKDLQTVHQDGVFVVKRWAAADFAIDGALATLEAKEKKLNDRLYSGAKGFSEALEELFTLFRNTKNLRYKIKIFHVDPAEGGPKTKQYFSSSGRTPTGMIELHATWAIRWDGMASGDTPRIGSLVLENLELVQTQERDGALFSDCTEAALSNNSCYQEQVLRGMNHWFQRSTAMRNVRRDGGYDFGTNTPGIALGDVNGDGLDDLYLCQENGLPNRLFLHNKDGTATDASKAWGVDWLQDSRSALFFDWDNDGDQDLAVAIRGGVVLAENVDQRQLRYINLVETSSDNMSITAADYDADGDLDLYVCAYYRNLFDEPLSPDESSITNEVFVPHDANNGGRNRLLRNDGGGRFVDVTQLADLDANNRRYSFAAAWEDFDNDGDPDIYVANDFGRDNLYRNDGGKFTDISEEARIENSATGMGIAWGDYDRDGWMDSYVSNMWSSAGLRISHQPKFKASNPHVRNRLQRFARGNTLLKNLGNGTFNDVSGPVGVELGRWAWGNQFVDVNSDGWEDLVVANGYLTGIDDSGDL